MAIALRSALTSWRGATVSRFAASAVCSPRLLARQLVARHQALQSTGILPAQSFSSCARRFQSTSPEAPKPAVEGMRVGVNFTLYRDDNGAEEVVDSSDGKDLLTFVCGAGRILPGLDAGVRGMVVGESKVVSLEGDAGFGARDDKKTMEVPLDKLPEGVEVGSELQMEGRQGSMPAVVKSIAGKTATLDFNHPMAGQPLKMRFTVESLEEVPKVEGLKVETTSPGDGKTYPKKGDNLTMHYTGTLAATGAPFDSSHEHGQPFSFQIGVGQVIRGWDEGVMQMSLGESARLLIPADLGYGATGAAGAIPPNADLIFDVELLKIN